MKAKWPNYSTLVDALDMIESEMSPSEVQGMQLGLICGSNKIDEKAWNQTILSQLSEMSSEALMDDSDTTGNSLDDLCSMLLQASLESIQNADLKLRLFLPDDKESLFFRTDMLGSWCRGFLFGIGLSGLTKEDLAQEDVAEILRDIDNISQISVDETDTSEDAERSFMELVEYLRIGVMTLFTEIALKRWGIQAKNLH